MAAATPHMYGELAGWFHLLTAPDEYAEEAAEVLELLEAHVEGPLTTALELGSGGGNLASHLSRLRLTLTDLEWDRDLRQGSRVVETDYVIVTRDGEQVSIHHDVHVLGIFPRATWLALLADVGFEACRVAGEQGLDVFIGARRRR